MDKHHVASHQIKLLSSARHVTSRAAGLRLGKAQWEVYASSHRMMPVEDMTKLKAIAACWWTAFEAVSSRVLPGFPERGALLRRPLFNLDGGPSSHLPVVMQHFAQRPLRVERVPVPFEFQRGATRMLRLWRV